MKTFKEWLVAKEDKSPGLDKFDLEAEREGNARYKFNRMTSKHRAILKRGNEDEIGSTKGTYQNQPYRSSRGSATKPLRPPGSGRF